MATLKPELQAQLDKLLKLRNGWLDGEGRAPNKQRLKRLFQMLDAMYLMGPLLPYVYPTPDGNVQIEWTIGRSEWSMEVDLNTYRGKLYGVRLDTDEEVDGGEYNLAHQSDRERLWWVLSSANHASRLSVSTDG
ncbi:hypothetical protein IW967_11385 [Alicyclobacillus mali]|uniref:DUF5348 domain-containing protein n=1 Tax=Alicyclobacillus mali (ex Roth et al. 2021) TaxID=1123961 RepID=A0ABS0F5B4_9BACL|nr:hypothetical protein [Alicyclobacillus mali (ex Roth et al. 2021)]MBF8378458.1 hypothetical protein [Alicyclobacillus mali (ex Roth et al. 2021)]